MISKPDVVAFLPYYSYFENPLYYEGYASGEDSSGDLVFGPGGGVLYLVEASLYLGSTLADQADVPQDGNNIPLVDDSVYNEFLAQTQPQQPNILFKVDAWGRSIRRIIPALFIYESFGEQSGPSEHLSVADDPAALWATLRQHSNRWNVIVPIWSGTPMGIAGSPTIL